MRRAIPLDRKTVLLTAAGLFLGTLLALALATRGPPPPPAHDLGMEIAQAWSQLESGQLKLGPRERVGATVLSVDGVPERNAPSFAPRNIAPEGAVVFPALERRAVAVEYRGDVEGGFLVVSLPRVSEDDLPLDTAELRYQGGVYRTFERKLPDGPLLRGVGGRVGSRWVFVVGTQRTDKLLALASVIPGF